MKNTDELVVNRLVNMVDHAIQSNKPPEIREAFDRLVKQGRTEDEARLLIAKVILDAISESISGDFSNDEIHRRMIKALNQLPEEESLKELAPETDKESKSKGAEYSDRQTSDSISIRLIAQLITIAGSLMGGVKLYIEHLKGKEIKIKKGDTELVLKGGLSRKEIEESISQFMELTSDTNDSIKIIKP
ncbi:MAG TPA: hypothetical protein VE732_08625 [Nitrososphaera sp.]|jgi:translation initiation factor 2 beta subunit (eIF-2beta)/eIF-5|nr:hypothetical protein [Nitrososphaera sp.]